MEEEEKNIPIEYLDIAEDWDEEDTDPQNFRPDKPKLTQLLPMLLFTFVFSFLGIDFFVQSELKDKWIDINTIQQPFTALFLTPQEKDDLPSIHDLEKQLQNNPRLASSHHIVPDSILQFTNPQNITILIANQETLITQLYIHRQNPQIRGYQLAQNNQPFYHFFLLKWKRIKLFFAVD